MMTNFITQALAMEPRLLGVHIHTGLKQARIIRAHGRGLSVLDEAALAVLIRDQLGRQDLGGDLPIQLDV